MPANRSTYRILGIAFNVVTFVAVHAVAAETEIRTQTWSSDAAGFAEFNAELMAQDDANLLKFPGARLIASDGINPAHTSMLTDGTGGVWVGTGRIQAADSRPSRIVFDLGRPRLIREIRVLTSNSDTRTNQDYEIRLARKAAGSTGLPPLPSQATYRSGDKVIGPNRGPCISSICNPAHDNLSEERFDVIEFLVHPTYGAAAGSPARVDAAKRGWTSLVELQVLADPDDPELFESPEQRRAWTVELERKRKIARLAGLSRLAADAINNLAPLERAIDDLTTSCPDRFPGARYRARWEEFVDRFGELKPEELDTPEEIQQLQLLTEQFEAFRREVLLSNPLLDFRQILFVQRSGPGNGLPANWQSNSQIRQTSFDDSIEILSLDDLDGETTTLFKPTGGLMVSDVDLHFDA
ncbi:MAG: hypothetical protein JJ992_16775, partial [Planctomycetes bacterium]|nr:hypothetical protein [Planctomycetota bacterium]